MTGNYVDGYTVVKSGGITSTLFTAVLASMPGGTALKTTQVDANTVLLQLSPWANFPTREGIKVAFNMQTSQDQSDAIGHYDTIFRGLSVTIVTTDFGVRHTL